VLPAVIVGIEFRGASHLVTLRLGTGEPFTLDAEVRARGIRELGLAPGARVPVRLPAARLHAFAEAVPA
jgi:hypothetical protein